MRERSRSRAFRRLAGRDDRRRGRRDRAARLLDTGGGTKDVGLTGATPGELTAAIQAQGDAVGTTARIHRYDSVAAGQNAVRDGDIDVLVVDARRLEWRRQADEQLQAVVTGAIQLVAVARAGGGRRDRAPTTLLAMVAPVAGRQRRARLGRGPQPRRRDGRVRHDRAAVHRHRHLRQLVLTGVVEEKSSRVVEVLLARMPARNLLAGKVPGIGLLGLAQIVVTALVALVAASLVDSVDIPQCAARCSPGSSCGSSSATPSTPWCSGALGSLASRRRTRRASPDR